MPYRILFVLIGAVCACRAAEPEPAPSPTPIEQGFRQMYNLQFTEAHQSFQEWEREHPADPLGPASDAAAYLFSEFDRLHILQSEFFTQDQHFITDHKLTPDATVKRQFEASLASARTLAAQAPNDPNAMFASLLAMGLHSDYLALIEKRYGASFQDMKAARALADRLLARDPHCYDAWIASGVENYMLSVKAAPMRWLLRLAGGETDRATGIERLRITAAHGRYLAPFASLLLAVAALRDRDAAKARGMLDTLAREYPSNPLYRQELARLEAPERGVTR